ncbi:MAG: hypothetical protein AB7S59_13290, partial [Parvibaculaceae bacterium]
MAKRDRKQDLKAIEKIVGQHPGGITLQEIAGLLGTASPRRTLQDRLKALVDDNRLIRDGGGRGARYRLPQAQDTKIATDAKAGVEVEAEAISLSREGQEIRDYVRQPPAARKPVGYHRAFLESYRPNQSFYLSAAERARLKEVGTPKIADQPAGTYAKHILNRLLIDLSWNSSRLEGNTYSLLDTRRLIELGEETEGKSRLEAQMILNHKDAIEFLVGAADEIGFNRYTVLNLHALLANNLLADP